MTPIEQAIAALELAEASAIDRGLTTSYEMYRAAINALRSIPGPATQAEIDALCPHIHTDAQKAYTHGFRAAERRIFGEGL